MGRTGKWLAHQWTGVVPDVITLAKGLGSGVPIGACLARGTAAGVFKPGNHGSTFGGGPLACVAALTTIDVIEKDGLLNHARRMGDLLKAELKDALSGVPGVRDIRGEGLMLGVELDRPCGDIVKRALAAGLLTNVTADKVIRIVPPLVIREAEVRQLAGLLAPVVKAFLAESSAAAA
jgi:acetylornithine aminotransferase